MRQHRSMFMLFSRSGLGPALGVLGAMCLVQGAMFRFAMGRGLYSTLEEVLAGSKIHLACCVAFWLLTGIMMGRTASVSGGMEYTLGRLRVSRWAVVGWSCLSSMLWYLVFWLLEGVLVLALSQWFLRDMEAQGGQVLLLACYRSEFLHSLVPLRDMSRWGRNLAMVVSFGVTTGCCVGKVKRGNVVVAVTCATVSTVMFMAPPCNGAGDALLAFVSLLLAFVSLILLYEGREEQDDEGAQV